MPAFPNVPIAPGVPPLLRAPGVAFAAIELITRDIIGTFLAAFQVWGIFKNGIPVIIADTVSTVDFKRDWSISNYPVEPDAFASYDKVQHPYDVRLRFAAGGSIDNHQAMLESIDTAAESLELLDVVTPERVYTAVNITHYDYRRTGSNGVGLLVVDVWCVQIRVAKDAAFTSSAQTPSKTSLTSTKEPSGASPVSGGTVQPSDVTLSSNEMQ